ncbi:MAG: hypothetical protein M3Y57_03310 [Acidobacteriota bacterium]|nr:hypothetical protein [Acidobacteriota bacterium]
MRSDVDDFSLSLQHSALDELVHELRQPLSVIESLAYFLELTSKDDTVCRHLQQIQAMVLQTNQILSKHRKA